MPPHRPVPLCSHPPLYTQDESIFDGFSPIREHKSSPDPPVTPVHSTTACTHCGSSAIPKSSPPRLQRKGLGSKDIHNHTTMRHTKNDSPNPSPTLKRGSVSLDTDDIRRLKRHRLTSVYEDDMDWIKREIKEIKEETKDIKAWMIKFEEFFKEEVNLRIGEVLYQLEQMN